MARGTKRLRELRRRRLEAARLFRKGERQSAVARLLKVSRQSVSRWFRAWSRSGNPGLRGSTRAGRPPRLDREQRARIRKALLQGPMAQGWPTDLWTLPRAAKLIESVAGVHYHPGHVWRIMKDLGWSLQRPTLRAKERDEQRIEAWKRRTWESVKKKRDDRAPG
jgi:transposase